eukprot:1184207-Prorocentrum_minimum.AAC.3
MCFCGGLMRLVLESIFLVRHLSVKSVLCVQGFLGLWIGPDGDDSIVSWNSHPARMACCIFGVFPGNVSQERMCRLLKRKVVGGLCRRGFAWVDVTGTIPTEIGLLTKLTTIACPPSPTKRCASDMLVCQSPKARQSFKGYTVDVKGSAVDAKGSPLRALPWRLRVMMVMLRGMLWMLRAVLSSWPLDGSGCWVCGDGRATKMAMMWMLKAYCVNIKGYCVDVKGYDVDVGSAAISASTSI